MLQCEQSQDPKFCSHFQAPKNPEIDSQPKMGFLDLKFKTIPKSTNFALKSDH